MPYHRNEGKMQPTQGEDDKFVNSVDVARFTYPFKNMCQYKTTGSYIHSQASHKSSIWRYVHVFLIRSASALISSKNILLAPLHSWQAGKTELFDVNVLIQFFLLLFSEVMFVLGYWIQVRFDSRLTYMLSVRICTLKITRTNQSAMESWITVWWVYAFVLKQWLLASSVRLFSGA